MNRNQNESMEINKIKIRNAVILDEYLIYDTHAQII